MRMENKCENDCVYFQIQCLQEEKERLSHDLDEVYNRHKEELEIQQLQHFQVKYKVSDIINDSFICNLGTSIQNMVCMGMYDGATSTESYLLWDPTLENVPFVGTVLPPPPPCGPLLTRTKQR